MNLEQKFDCKQGAIRAVRFNKDGNYCITCGSDKTIKLWNPYKPLTIQTYSGHSQEVLDADCSHDHSFICSASADKAIFYYDVATAKILRKFRGHAGRVQCVRFNKDESNLILSGSIDGKVKIWDLRARNFDALMEIDDCKDSVTYLDINSQQILVSCLDKTLRTYDIRFGKLICDHLGEAITCARFSRDDQCILVSVLSSRLYLLDKSNGQLLNEYTGHVNKTYQIESCFNNATNQVYSGSEDGHVYVWDLVDAQIKFKLKHSNEKAVHSISFHPDASKLLTAQENCVYLWTQTTLHTNTP